MRTVQTSPLSPLRMQSDTTNPARAEHGAIVSAKFLRQGRNMSTPSVDGWDDQDLLGYDVHEIESYEDLIHGLTPPEDED